MRTITIIKDEIKQHEDSIRELKNELEVFKKNCPHPDFFVSRAFSDSEDDCCGPGIYEYTVVKYECSLCEGKFYGKYDKNHEKAPTLEEVLVDI